MALRRFIRFASQPARALPLANAFVYTTPPRSTHSPGELYTSERSAAHTPGAHGDNTLLDLSHLTLLQCARLTPARAPILRRSSLQTLALLASPLLLHTHLLHTNCRSALLPRARPHTPPSIPCNALVTQPFANKIPYLPQNALLALVVNTYRVRTEKSRLRLSSPLFSSR